MRPSLFLFSFVSSIVFLSGLADTFACSICNSLIPLAVADLKRIGNPMLECNASTKAEGLLRVGLTQRRGSRREFSAGRLSYRHGGWSKLRDGTLADETFQILKFE